MVALNEAKKRLADKAQFVHWRFEDAPLPQRYNNIVFMRVLQHLDDPSSGSTTSG